MKLPTMNKQTIQSFFLYHTEKLIILAAIALMGWLFWSGYKTEVFDVTTPQQLSRSADEAGNYIVAEDSWTQIKDSRVAVESLPTILDDEGIDPSEFRTPIVSVAVKSLEPRKDPKLRPVTDLTAKHFTAPIYLASNSPQDPLEDIPFAVDASGEDEDDNDDRRRRPTRRNTGRDDDEAEEVKIPGENLPLVQHHEMLGLRPSKTRLNKNDRVMILDGVAVAGVVDVKQQYEEYQNSFAYGAGYYPDRDRPDYRYVQVERAEVVDGKVGQWTDISERIHEGQTRFYPAAAPEVVAPENYDEILSGVIPPVTLVDYKDIALHPKVKEREFPSLDEADEEEVDVPDNPRELFGRANDDDSQISRRVGPGVSRRGSGMSMQRSSEMKSVGSRRGSDKRPYEEAMLAEEPEEQHKLVRFFDLQTIPGKTYQYRVRLWLSDPNNDAEEGANRRSNRNVGRGSMADDMGMDMDMGMGMDMPMDVPTRSSRSSSRAGGLGLDGETKKVYKKIPITSNMKSPESRIRLGRAREEADPDDSNRMIYYVYERYGEGEGDEQWEEIKVPRRAEIDIDALFDLDELRFARPTPWSEPVSVKISAASRVQVAAGDVTPPKMDRVGDAEVPDGEPIANLAVGVWSKKYHTLVAAKREARRGEVLNFSADPHVLNPVTWAIHKLEREEIKTDVIIVDAMGGQLVDTGRNKELMEHRIPGDVLVLNAAGEFEVHNGFEDQKVYRHSLFIHDESPEVGEVKKPKDRGRGRGRGGRFGR